MTDTDVHVRVASPDPLVPRSDAFARSGGSVHAELFNGDFRVPPPDPALPIDNLDNQLPGWTIGTVGGLTLAAFWDEATFDTPCILVVATSGLTADSLYLEQTLWTPGAVGIEHKWAVRAEGDLLSGTGFTRVQYLDGDGVATGTGDDVSIGSLALANSTGLIPDAADTLRVRVGFVLTGGYTGTVGDIGAIYADRHPDLALASNIRFPATQVPSANVNTLDDYEEGTWTPTPSYAVVGTSTWVLTTRTGRYTKIGNRVFWSLYILATPTNGTATGQLVISGLPFTVVNVANVYGVSATAFDGWTKANYTSLSVYATLNITSLGVLATGNGQAMVLLGVADLPTGTAKSMHASGHYETA